MALRQGLTTSFKHRCLSVLDGATLMMALYGESATLGPDTATYTTDGEIEGTGYTAGGVMLTGVVISTDGTVAYLTFDAPERDPAGFSARGALIYDATDSNSTVAVLDFGSLKTVTTRFAPAMPSATADAALVRLE